MRQLKPRLLWITIVAVALMAAPGCGGHAAAQDAEQVTYRLKWLFNASVVGDLYAEAQGMFKARGLQVTIKEGGPERDPIKELELGRAQFGVASADQVIRALSKGSPVRVVAQLFQINPLQWIYRPDKTRIERPEELKGKVIGVTFGGNDETIMRTLLAKYGIREAEVTLFSVRYDYTPFYQGKVDLWPVYRNAQGPIIADKLRRSGETIRYFDPHAAGVRFVANSVVTSEKTLRERPELVEAFVGGLMEGWREALIPANRDKALAVLRQFDRDTLPAIQEIQLAATRDLIVPQAGGAVGDIDLAGWVQTEEIMRAQGVIPAAVNIEKYLWQPKTGR